MLKTKKQGLILALIILFLDQVIKEIMINFNHVQNTGAAWGILRNSTFFLIIISIVVVFYINRYFSYHPLAVSILLGGTLGNLIDRIFRGYVIDYINIYIFNFPLFNLADIAISCSIILIIWKMIKEKN
jgi:signal peptidase II